MNSVVNFTYVDKNAILNNILFHNSTQFKVVLDKAFSDLIKRLNELHKTGTSFSIAKLTDVKIVSVDNTAKSVIYLIQLGKIESNVTYSAVQFNKSIEVNATERHRVRIAKWWPLTIELVKLETPVVYQSTCKNLFKKANSNSTRSLMQTT